MCQAASERGCEEGLRVRGTASEGGCELQPALAQSDFLNIDLPDASLSPQTMSLSSMEALNSDRV